MFKHFFTKSTNRKMEELKDVELVSEGIAISFNKLILAIHSRYFRVLFSMNGFQEMDKNKIEITVPISPETLNSIKTFIYSGKVTVTRKTIKKLLEAFTFFMIDDGYGKLDDAIISCMRRYKGDYFKLDDYEQRLYGQYCVLNHLYRCCNSCGLVNIFEICEWCSITCITHPGATHTRKSIQIQIDSENNGN